MGQKVHEWAFITAHNPFSKQLPDSVNSQRHRQLLDISQAYPCWEGEGVGSDASSKPERSLLIVGINQQEAVKIAKRFEQNAIVYGRIHEAAELLLLFDLP